MSATTRQRLRSAGTVLAIVLLGAAVPVAVNVAADANGAFNCSAGFQVDETLTNGARWQMCWEKRAREGIVIHDVTYTPIGGQPVEVLSEAALAQIHVPYDDNGARFHDLSDFGLGSNMDALSAGDCPNGTLLSNNWLCQTEAPTGYAYKSYDEVADATSLNLFSASCIGAYCYVVAWNFDDDGTVRPEVGATGTLQRYGGNPQTTWPMGGGRRAVAHMHNFYWRLDFDVNGAPNDRRRGARGPILRQPDPARQHPTGVLRRGGPPGRPRELPELAGAGLGHPERGQPPDLLGAAPQHRQHLPGPELRGLHPERALRDPQPGL